MRNNLNSKTSSKLFQLLPPFARLRFGIVFGIALSLCSLLVDSFEFAGISGTASAQTPSPSPTADPRFPRGTNVDVALEAMGSVTTSALQAKMQQLQSTFNSYANWGKQMGFFPTHTLQCLNPAFSHGTRQSISEFLWKFDMLSVIANPVNFQKFLGCFEGQVGHGEMAAQLLFWNKKPCVKKCFKVLGVVGGCLEVCYDLPGICCAVSKYVLHECGATNAQKDDFGFYLAFWWPENIAQINNYEVAGFDPTYECNNDGTKILPTDLDFDVRHSNLMDSKSYEKGLRDTTAKYATSKTNQDATDRIQGGLLPHLPPVEPNIGQSHWSGIKPGDQVFSGEAHVYQTYLNVLGRLNRTNTNSGFKDDCTCFYNLLDDWDYNVDRVHTGWTELPKYMHFWRYWQYSEYIDPQRFEAISSFQSPLTDLCASLRAYHPQWSTAPYNYGDLIDAVGVKRPSPKMYAALERICFRGGGELFPLTGTMIGHFSPLPAGAYLARRAFHLFSVDRLRAGNTNSYFMPPGRRMHKYSDQDDKIQRVWPLSGASLAGLNMPGAASECFRGHEIPNYLFEGNANWPRDLIEPNDLIPNPMNLKDDMRFVHWNMRKGCMCPWFGQTWFFKGSIKLLGITLIDGQFCKKKKACKLKYSGDRYDYDTASAVGPLLGDQGHNITPELMTMVLPAIPYPFMPDVSSKALFYKLGGNQDCILKPPSNKCVRPNNPSDNIFDDIDFSDIGGDEDDMDTNLLKKLIKWLLSLPDQEGGSGRGTQTNICLPEWTRQDGGIKCKTGNGRCQ